MDRASGKVLIVDDEPSLLRMMSVFLNRLGYVVETSGSKESALACIEHDPSAFDVAVVDASMPGIEVADLAIRMLRTGPGLRVIAASGYAVDMTEVDAAAPGRAAYLAKPFTPEMLATMVRRMLGQEERV